MKRILALMAAIAVVSFFGETTATAQPYQNGYQFGAGLNASGFTPFAPFGYRGPQLAGRGGYGGYGYPGISGGFAPFLGAGIFTRRRIEEPPYFAKFPPVYYSHVVKRPYGVSPFAAPSGILPIEMTAPQPQPLSLQNPHFRMDVAPVSNEAPEPAKQTDETKNQSTWVSNPYFHQAFAFGGQ